MTYAAGCHGLEPLIDAVDQAVRASTDEHLVTAKVAEALRRSLAGSLRLSAPFQRPNPERYVMYPLHVDPDARFSIAAAVWNVGQGTPVHGHETWGVVGIYSGRERERQYAKPTGGAVPLVAGNDVVWGPGEVTVCCTTDDDVHKVNCEGAEPCVGVHIYGADIGTLERRSYDPATGAVRWFVSSWADPAASD